MGISGFFGRRNITGLRVVLEPPDEIYAGTTSRLKVIVHNDKRHSASFLIRVMIDGSGVLLPVIKREGSSIGFLQADYKQRGIQRIDNIYISSVFPFNFFTRFKRFDTAFDITVFPAPKKCSIQTLMSAEKKSKGDRSLDRSGFESEILAIRDYHYGDPQKYIHWKASAKTGKLKTKELSSMSHRPIVIDFDETNIQDIEERISCIAYTLLKSFRMNQPVGLTIAGRTHKLSDNTVDSTAARALKIIMMKELAVYGR
jgi:uncharacterized protein (DUF58 family)